MRLRVKNIQSYIREIFLIILAVTFSSRVDASEYCDGMFSSSSSFYKVEKTKYKGGGYSATSKGFRINEINPIIIQMVDLFDIKFFDELYGKIQSSYLPHNTGLSAIEAKVLFIKIDEFLYSFFKEILVDRKEDDLYDVMEDPDILRYIIISLLKILSSRKGFPYADIEGEVYWISNHDSKYDLGSYTVAVNSDVVWNSILPDVKKKLISSMLNYYIQRLGLSTPIGSNRKIHVEETIYNLADLIYSDEVLSYKKKKYKMRVTNSETIRKNLSEMNLVAEDSKPIHQKVYEETFLKKITGSEFFRDIVRKYPYLLEQDLSFIIKFLKGSLYQQEFVKFVESKFKLDDKMFLLRLLYQSDISDLDQLFYIGPFSFSIKQILRVVQQNKKYNFSLAELLRAYKNLLGGEKIGNVDLKRFYSQLGKEEEFKKEVSSQSENFDFDLNYNKNFSLSQILEEDNKISEILNDIRNVSSEDLIKIFVQTLIEVRNLEEALFFEDELVLLDMYIKNKGFKEISAKASKSGVSVRGKIDE